MKNIEELKTLKEGQNIELKAAVNKLPASFWETYSSFANTDGGTIYLGIEERKSADNIIVGVTNPAQTKTDIMNGANNRSKVSLNVLADPAFDEYQVEEKTVLAVHIRRAEFFEKPVYIDNNPLKSFRRLGDGDYLMGQAEIKSLWAYQAGSPSKSLDTVINAQKYRLSDLDPQSLSSYRERFNRENRDNRFADQSDELFFTAIGAARKEGDEYLATNAGLLCFGYLYQIKEAFPFFQLDYIQSDGQSIRWNRRISSDDLFPTGNLFQFIREVTELLSGNLPAPFYFQDGFDTGKKLLFETVREGLINAVFNADYSLPGGVKMVFAPNEVAIRNPGLFVIDLQNALYGGLSVPRNAGVASIFRSIHYGEKAGTGIPAMAENMRRFAFPDIAYEQDANSVATTLRLYLVPGLDEQSRVLLRLVAAARDGLSVAEAMERLHLGRRKADELLSALQAKGLIKNNGQATKGKRYLKAWRTI